MRVGFIGCVDSSSMALRALLEIDSLSVAAVVTRNKSTVNADFFDLSKICQEHKIPYHFEDPKHRELSIVFFKQYKLDLVFCIGWSYLLSQEMLSLPRLGIIGFHPAKLPENRGRHPIIWALALGLEETASTFFRMDGGADSGPIVSQESIRVSPKDDSKSLYGKILAVARKQIFQLGNELHEDRVVYKEQNHSKATYWRKRARKDGTIDFRMSASSINNLVRALAPPYPCAEFVYDEVYVKVTSSSIAVENYPINIEPGKILDIDKDRILVKTAGKEAIWLHGIENKAIDVRDYL